MKTIPRTVILITLLGVSCAPAAEAAEAISGPLAGWRAARDVVCLQPGVESSEKIPADSMEVANDCAAGAARVLRAKWWGGYVDWNPGEPLVTCFHVRFYRNEACTPSDLIAAYLDAEAETTRVGDDPQGRPCFLYELVVDVPVGPDPFWMSIQTACRGRYPPKWGRLGDEVLDGCNSQWQTDGGGWNPVPTLPDWDASQAFEVEDPTPVHATSWGRLRRLYR
jgi:hypothetical protein